MLSSSAHEHERNWQLFLLCTRMTDVGVNSSMNSLRVLLAKFMHRFQRISLGRNLLARSNHDHRMLVDVSSLFDQGLEISGSWRLLQVLAYSLPAFTASTEYRNTFQHSLMAMDDRYSSTYASSWTASAHQRVE